MELFCIRTVEKLEKKLPILKDANPTPAKISNRLDNSNPAIDSEKLYARPSILSYRCYSFKNKHKVI